MRNPIDGGPAFPTPAVYVEDGACPRRVEEGVGGMTLRDYFAAAALAGIFGGRRIPLNEMDEAKIARRAYQFADALLKAGRPAEEEVAGG